MAVDSTPERSFSLLFRSSRAAEAMTGCGPVSPRWAVVIIARRVVSIGRFGSDRKFVTPANVLSASKGGLNPKLHAVCDGTGRPIIFLLTEGQMSDHKDAAIKRRSTRPSSRRKSDPISARELPEPALIQVDLPLPLSDRATSAIEDRVAKGFIIVADVVSDAVGANRVLEQRFRPAAQRVPLRRSRPGSQEKGRHA